LGKARDHIQAGIELDEAIENLVSDSGRVVIGGLSRIKASRVVA
jgi:hypothetical protein